MLDGISQSLVNMASKVGKGDLDKGVVFDTQTGKFAVNRNADQMGLGDHNFFQNEAPTELGRQNAVIRGALANSLKKIVSEGGGLIGQAQQKALDEIFATLFGAADATGKYGSDIETYRPISARTVKQLVTKAQKAHAQAALEALPDGGAKIDNAEKLIAKLCANASLHGKTDTVQKMVEKLEGDLAKCGAKLEAATTERARTKAKASIVATVDKFIREASKLAANMYGADSAVDAVLDEYMDFNDTFLGPVFCTQFRRRAMGMLENGMTFDAFKAKIGAALPGIVQEARANASSPLIPRQPGVAQPAQTGLSQDTMDAVRAGFQASAANGQALVQNGTNLVSVPRFSVGADKFDAAMFLKGQPTPADNAKTMDARFTANLRSRGADRPAVRVVNPDGSFISIQNCNASHVDTVCGGAGVQSTAVKAAMMLDLGRLVGALADELHLDGMLRNGVKKGCDCTLTLNSDGSVDVTLATKPGSSVESSLTLRISTEGERSLVSFSGVKTSDAFADKVEQDARRAAFVAKMNPDTGSIVKMAAAKLAEIKQYVEAPNVSARLGEANAAILQESVTAVFNGLIGELRHLADDPAARLEKTPDQYERDFATQLGNLRQRTLERIQSNLFLVGDFRDSLRRIESRCNAAAAKLDAAGMSNLANVARDFLVRTNEYLRDMQSNFVLSGEVSEQAARELTTAVKAFAERAGNVFAAFEAKDRPTTEDGLALATGLAALRCPVLAFRTFSESARTAMLSASGLLSTEAVDRAAIGKPGYGPAAAAVSEFADTVNNLLSQAGKWSNNALATEFRQLAEGKLQRIVQTVKDGIDSGADLSRGIGGVLAKELKPLFDAFANYERQDIQETFAAKVDAHIATLRDALERGVSVNGVRVPLSDAQRADVDDAIVRVDALKEGLQNVQGNNRPITRESLAALTARLGGAVERFMAKLANPGPSRAPRQNYFASVFGGVGARIESDADYRIRLPAVQADYNQSATNAANPFAGQGGAGFASFDELSRTVRAEIAIGRTINADNPELKAMALDIFHELEEARPFLDIDAENNIVGFKQIGDGKPGELVVAAALKAAVARRTAECVAELATLQNGAALDVEKYTGPAGMTALKAAIRESFAAEIDRYADVVEAAGRPVAELLPGEVLKRGNDVFGLDLEYIRKEGKLEALKTIVLGMFTTDSRWAYLTLKAENPEAADRMMDRWLHQREPLTDNLQSALLVDGASLKGLKASLLDGSLPLDGSINLATALVLQNLCKVGYENAGQPELGSAGFANPNAGENLALLVRNGLTPEKIAQFCSTDDAGNPVQAPLDPGNKASALFSRLSGLFLINRCDAGGLDALTMRIVGKHLCDLTAEDDKMIVALRLGVRDASPAEYRSVSAYELDPFTRLDDAQKAGAMFFMRTATPTTAHVPETMAIYRALKAMSAPNGPVESEVTYNGVRFTLRLENGVLTANEHVNIEKWELRPGWNQVHRAVDKVRRDVSIPFVCPLDVQGFIGQIEEEIAAHATAYGREAARALFTAEGFDAGSSRARQLALNVISGMTGTLAAELCHVPTTSLVELARGMLQTAGDPKAFFKERLAGLGGDGVPRFNGAATLELYRKMQAADRHQVDEMVRIPEEPKTREGETLAQASLRRVHEFIAELVMPDDTTRYDIDRDAGKTDADIMRRTLLSHKAELRVILRSLGTDTDLLDTFSLATGDAVNNVVPRTHEVATALKSRMLQLKSMVDAAGGIDAFYLALEANDGAGVPGLADFLNGFTADLAAASDKVLAKMQGVLTARLSAAFRQSTASAKNKPLWQKTLDEIAGAGTLDVDTGYGQLLMEALSTYFSKMEPIDRHRMASSLLRYAGSDSNSGEILGALIKGAGPVLQKLMQGLPQTALPADLRQAVADLKSNLPSIPPEMVRATLLDMVQRSNGRITSIELTKSLGAATVGQAFLCKIVTVDNPAGEECVVKILRPDVQARARRERDLFLDIAKRTKGMAGVFDVRLEGIFKELDFTVEANNVKQGAIYTSGVVNDKIGGVRSMELYPFIGATANTLVVRKAPGVTFDRYIADSKAKIESILGMMKKTRNEDGSVTYLSGDMSKIATTRAALQSTYEDILARQKHLTNFIEKWTFEAIFDGGFFHGDVHAGNLMCDGSHLTVIDYGNASRFSAKELESLKWALAWIPAKNAAKFVEHYEKLLSPAGRKGLAGNRDALVKALQEIFDRADSSDVGRIMAAAFQLIQEQGVELPGPIFGLLQSMQRLDETARLMNEQLSGIKTALNSMRLTDTLQEGERVPDFLAPLLEMMNPETGAKVVEDGITLKAIFEEFQKSVAAESTDKADLNQYTQAARRYITNYVMRMGPKPDGAPPTYEEKMLEMVDTAADNPDSAEARDAIFAQLEDIRAFASTRVEYGDPSERISAAQLLATLGATPPEPISGHREEWRQYMSSLIRGQLASVVPGVFSGLENTFAGEDYEGNPEPVVKPYEDASAGFGKAINRGSEKFAASFSGFGGALNALSNGAIGLRGTLKEIAKVARRESHRESYVDANYGGYAAQHGIYAMESVLIEKAMQDFRFMPHLAKTLAKPGWNTRAENRQSVVQSLAFNIEIVMSELARAGFAERVANPERRKAFIELAMTKLIAPHPEWYHALENVDAAGIDQIAGDNADVKTALQFLKSVAENPPDDRLTAEDNNEIDQMFRII